MRVSGQEYLRASQIRQVRRVADVPEMDSITTASVRGSSAAQVDFSAMAKEIQQVVGSVAREPQIREEVVARLRERIESGTYQVSGEQIGEMMLRRFIADRVS